MKTVEFACTECKQPSKARVHNNFPSDELKLCNDCGFLPDWKRKCETCGAKPVVMATGLCGPCTFGEASTAGGNW